MKVSEKTFASMIVAGGIKIGGDKLPEWTSEPIPDRALEFYMLPNGAMYGVVSNLRKGPPREVFNSTNGISSVIVEPLRAELVEQLPAERPAPKIFSFDGETNGLWGSAFSIGALVYDEHGVEIARFIGRLPDSAVTDNWARDNVLPEIATVPVSHETYAELIRDFAEFYMTHKAGADIVTHMGYIVETKILRDMHEMGYIGDWDAPYPLFDVANNLQAAGYDPTSVDNFAAYHGLTVGEFEGGTHNPLYDAAITAAVYRHLTARDLG